MRQILLCWVLVVAATCAAGCGSARSAGDQAAAHGQDSSDGAQAAVVVSWPPVDEREGAVMKMLEERRENRPG